METSNKLTEQEQLFCDLYANGEAPYGGNASRCYQEVFNDKSRLTKSRATRMYEETKYMKVFLRENLTSIIEECSQAEYRDRKGTMLSPAALRSVAVNASKALMELCALKGAQVSKINIEGAGEGGITFNVIMPEQSKEEE